MNAYIFVLDLLLDGCLVQIFASNFQISLFDSFTLTNAKLDVSDKGLHKSATYCVNEPSKISSMPRRFEKTK